MKFKFNWVIKILSKDEDGIQIELADLATGKHMIVATDTKDIVATNTFNQAGFGPFDYHEGMDLKEIITTLKENLLHKRKIKK